MARIMLYLVSLFVLTNVVCAEKVLLISMDGFRWDYIQNASTPNFDKMARMGTRAQYINNTFTTKTFPCHYSIATGLYEESHGVVANRMYDPEFDEFFSLGNKETKWWDGGEPIWVTARKRGLNSAVYFWPGSESEIRGLRPNIWMPYLETTPFDERVDTVIGWLNNDSLAIDIALLYFHEPDKTGHLNGPYSNKIVQKVEEMDALLGTVLAKIDKAGLTDTVNIIVTSDHGMTEVDSNTRVVDLSKYIDTSAIKIITEDGGPIIMITPEPGRLGEMYTNLSTVSHMRVFLKDDIPDYWHYQNNRRILQLLLVADNEWLLAKDGSSYTYYGRGTHGFDNQLNDMKPIFYAKGPRIRKGFQVEPFKSVDIYPFICDLLGIQPSPNNGTLDIIRRMMDDTIAVVGKK